MGQTAYLDDRDFNFDYQDTEKGEVLTTKPDDDRALHKARDSVAEAGLYAKITKRAVDNWPKSEHIVISLKELQNDLLKQKISRIFKEFQPEKILVGNQSELTDYLKKYPDLIQVVRLACEKAREEFQFPDQLFLDMFYDPESDDKYPTLYVRQKVYDKDILDRIDVVSEKFDTLLASNKGWFLITTDFETPQ